MTEGGGLRSPFPCFAFQFIVAMSSARGADKKSEWKIWGEDSSSCPHLNSGEVPHAALQRKAWLAG